MKLIKISPKFQITIPRTYRHHCQSGWFSLTEKEGILILRPIEIQETKTGEEVMEELMEELLHKVSGSAKGN